LSNHRNIAAGEGVGGGTFPMTTTDDGTSTMVYEYAPS
jgi:hypothetical protein